MLTSGWSQLTPAFSSAQGGFQQGTTLLDNGWEVLNGTATNGWAIGGNYPGATDGRCVYLTSDYNSSNPTTTLVNPGTTSLQVVHLFRNVTLPATDSAIFLQFRTTSFISSTIQLSVHLDTSSLSTLTAGFTTGNPLWSVVTGLVNSGNFATITLQVPPSFAGKSARLRFEYRPLANLTNINGNSRGFAIDDVTLLTRPFANNTITAQAAGGNWSSGSTWVGGLVPSSGEDVAIPNGTTVNFDMYGLAGTRNLLVQGIINGNQTFIGTAGSLFARGSITVAGTGQLQTRDRTIRLGGHLTAQPGALIDLRRGTLQVDSTGWVTVQRVITLDSMGQFQNRVMSTFICSAAEGLRFQVASTLNDTLRLYNGLSALNGQINHQGRLLLDNTLGVSLAGASSNSLAFVLGVNRGSYSSFPLLGASCNLEVRYTHTATATQPLIAGSRNEIPANCRIGRLTTGSAFSFLRIPFDLYLTDNAGNTLWLLVPVVMGTGKKLVLLNSSASTGTQTANQGHLQGKLVMQVNTTTAQTKRFIVGLNGIPTHFELRGITTSGDVQIGVESILASAGTPAVPLTSLSPIARLRLTIDSGAVPTIAQVAAFYTVADGIQPDQIANLRIGRSTTSLISGSYISIGPFTTTPTASPVVSDVGNWGASTTFFTLALAGGTFRKLWTGAAGDNTWDTPENWSGNTVPSCTDSVVLAPQFVNIKLLGDQQIGALEVGQQTTLELQSGSRLRIGCAPGTGRLLINGFGGNGHFYGIKALPGSTLRVE